MNTNKISNIMTYENILRQIEDKTYNCPLCNKKLRNGTKYVALQIQNKLTPITCHKCLQKTNTKMFYQIYRNSIRQAQHKYYEKNKGEKKWMKKLD